MRHFALALIASFAALPASAAEPIAVVIDAPLQPPAKLALAELERVLQGCGFKPSQATTIPADGPAIVIGTADSPLVERLLKAHLIALPKAPESLCIKKLKNAPRPFLLIAGRDTRGLGYALREAARALELADKGQDLFNAVADEVEEPFLRTRSLTVHLFNADLEEEWCFDQGFWRSYFGLLARSRFNNFTLTFTDQTNYLNPPYPYLVDVPGYPLVRVKGQSDAERKRRLAMLRSIAELAHEHGLDFTLGIWTQLPVAQFTAKVRAQKLPAANAAADFCAAGLKRVLQECPGIDAVQLRMNAEAGVAEDQQTEFYWPLFRSIRDCGRAVRVDLRYKGLRPETIRAAVDLGLDVAVSTKFWCEHMGLPYHPTVADRHYRDDRYGFGDLLRHERNHRLVYQLWTVGSQRLLSWGDPDYAARFARSCRLGDGEGFEVFAPLTNKGFGDRPGRWSVFADRTLEESKWEFERFWFFYLVFGRLGFNPQAAPEVWRREFRARFGEGADAMEAAYRAASQIIPLLTATHQLSAGEWMWWPEMDTGDRLAEYARIQPSDRAQFYAVRAWKRTTLWRCEEWDDDVPGFVEDAVARRLSAKWTPPQVSRRLSELSEQTLGHLERARGEARDPKTAVFRATELDLRVLAQLALYHAGKTLAATELGFFELTGETGRLPRALKQMRAAEAAWKQIVQLTDGAYHPNLVFGYGPGDGRKLGHHHSGHWKDRLAEVSADVADLEKLLAKHGGDGRAVQSFPGESPVKLPRVEHAPIATAAAGVDLALDVQTTTEASQVVLHYRPLNQRMDWKHLTATAFGQGRWRATIPARDIAPDWDLQYYFEALVEGGGGRLWPSWEAGPPYVVVRINRALK